ncbi:helix-turn-helix transcriptional regulator [Amycolatopsis rubida]|uniref:Helix-turn-helix transcriptional regulator n=1 Tax=Amycolatopsis rubida TaxID=112413 RepID=A0ABX0C0E3_9PSEU|nr:MULTISPECIES: helix-turn-helix transcriptional regulator [Amycolatopsis]MYW94952.1 helix-turn-helix domain-containing protein [Amycolatopsis rubida]NEC59939.1 helix-turn-helix transcriptional regulator [Amycolatopsis rubida]OAP25676.1 helix-turn-helix protein [Amycolatopsis sp. M39]
MEVELSNVIGAHIKVKRTAAGLNLPQLAERSGVAVSTISRIESGAKLPTLPTLLSLDRVLDLELAQLLADLGARSRRNLPEFEEYLRQKYGMPEEAIADIAAYFHKEATDN